nr:hypothetical protein [Nocardiopsis sp. FR6]
MHEVLERLGREGPGLRCGVGLSQVGADRVAKRRVRHQAGQFDPGLQLGRRGVRGQDRAHLPQPADETLRDVQALADLVPEVVDGLFPFLVRHRDELVHQVGPNGLTALFDQGPEHRQPGPQGAFLVLDDLQVRGEQSVRGRTALDQAADLGQVGVELTQGPDEFQPGDGVNAVHPATGYSSWSFIRPTVLPQAV